MTTSSAPGTTAEPNAVPNAQQGRLFAAGMAEVFAARGDTGALQLAGSWTSWAQVASAGEHVADRKSVV